MNIVDEAEEFAAIRRAAMPLLVLAEEIYSATARQAQAIMLPRDMFPDITGIYGLPVIRCDLNIEPGVVFR